MSKTHTITYKNYMPSMAKDTQLDRAYADIEYGYGKTEFTGTDEELSAFIAGMRKESPGINIIGIV